jgi:hypothetical protein
MSTAPIIGRDRHKPGPTAAVHHLCRLGQSGPLGGPPVEMLEPEPSCAAPAMVSSPPW